MIRSRQVATGWLAGLVALLFLLAGGSPAMAARPALPQAFRLPSGPLAAHDLYVWPDSQAARAARSARTAPELSRLAAIPQGIWLTGGSPDAVRQLVGSVAAAAQRQRAVPTFVIYDIPHRDCRDRHSAGGAVDAAHYRDYVSAIASANRGRPAIVVVEPDALAQLDCLAPQHRQGRLQLIRWAVDALARPDVLVYLDAGSRGQTEPAAMASRLVRAGVARARGFALNVANFDATSAEIGYGRAISGRIGWKRFVIDTSRNGAGPDGRRWCNPPGRAVGPLPGTPPGDPAVDALLWIKNPGESDGRCGTIDRPAGEFAPGPARELMRRGGW